MHIFCSLLILLSFCFNLYSQTKSNLQLPSDQIATQTQFVTRDNKNKLAIFKESMSVNKTPRNVLKGGVLPENRLAALLVLGSLCEKGEQTKEDTAAILYSIQNEGVAYIRALAITYYAYCMNNDYVDDALYNFIKQGVSFSDKNTVFNVLTFVASGATTSLLNINIPYPGYNDTMTLFLGAVKGLTASSTFKSTRSLIVLNKDYINGKILRTNYDNTSPNGVIQRAILEGLYEKALSGDFIAEAYLTLQMKLTKGSNYTKLGNPYYDETSKITSTFLMAKLRGREVLPYINAIGKYGNISGELKGECAYWADRIDPRPSAAVYATGSEASYRTAPKPNYSDKYQVELFKKAEAENLNTAECAKLVVLWILTDGLFEFVGPPVKIALKTFSRNAERFFGGGTKLNPFVSDATSKQLVEDGIKAVTEDSKLAPKGFGTVSDDFSGVVNKSTPKPNPKVNTPSGGGNGSGTSYSGSGVVETNVMELPEAGAASNKVTSNIITPKGGYTDVNIQSSIKIQPVATDWIVPQTILNDARTAKNVLSIAKTATKAAVVTLPSGISYLIDPEQKAIKEVANPKENLPDWKHPDQMVEEFNQKERVTIEIVPEEGGVLVYTVWITKGDAGEQELAKIITTLKPLGDVKVKSYDYDEQGKLINKKDESPYNIKNETANPDSPSAEESLSGKTMDGRPITIRKLETDEKGLELEDYEAQGMNLHSVAVEINIGDKKLIGISRPISSGNNASQAAYDLALYINQKVGKQIINVADTFTYSTKNRDLYTFEKYPDDSSETQKILSVVGDIYVFDFIIANNRVKYDLVTRNGIDYLINNGTAFPENLESNDQLFISFVKKMQQEDRFLTIEMKKFISEADLSEILVIIANSVIDLNQRTLLVERIQSLKSILNIFPYRPSTQAAVITDPPKNATPKAAQQSGTGYSPQQEKVAIDTILAEPKEYSSQQEVLNYIRITDEAFFNKILENVDSKNIKAFLDKLSKQIFESEVNVAEVTNKLYEIPNNKLNQYVNNYLVAPNNPFVVRTLFSETHNFFSKQLENLPINLIKKNALIEKMTKEVVEHNSNSSSMLYDFDSLPYYKQLEFINAYLKSNELFNKVIEEFKPAPKTNKDLIFLSGSSKLETPVLERTHESVYKELFDRSKLLKELLTSDPELAKEFADLLAENIAENAQIGIMNSKNEIVPLLASQVSMNNIIRNLDKLMKDDLVYLLRTTEEHDHSMLLWEVAGDISLKEEEDDGISVDLMLNFCKKLQAEMLQDNSFHIQTIIRKLNLMNKHDRERFMQLILSPENDVAILEFISSDYMLEFTYKLSANEINKKFLANKELILRFIELGQEECSKMRGFFEILSKAMAEEGLTERIVDNSINGLLDLKKWPDSALRHEVNIVLDPDWWTARKSLGLLGKIIKYHQ